MRVYCFLKALGNFIFGFFQLSVSTARLLLWPVLLHIRRRLSLRFVPILCPCSQLLYLHFPPLLTSTLIPNPMSEEPRGQHQVTLDAETGTLDPLPIRLPYDEKAQLPYGADSSPAFTPTKEKDSALTTTKEVVLSAKPTKPVPKPKKKVSKWVLFRLWFNTYRYGHALFRL